MSYQQCAKCRERFFEGQLKCVISIQVTGDTDNVLPNQISDEEMKALIEDLKQSDPDDVERDVHEKYSFVLCKQCKNRFVRDPFGSEEDLFGGFQ